ncbi:efflux RND transporter periplasmic adaptor subunit [Gemmatimonas sp.]|uniref:efflux RND transporter periplasmic adaptor subunit n=1 Tax=Gemmatimonas sp. TaxID=1962908 RepID=UPI0025BF6152|nr:efflux RND transporter periplasmic adaptor subunit [Gemmatimonas sp.]MCA2995887.1 efflux RND transporter periplasmic adaptor subunit [Gemmatimonas sp.]
MTGRILFLAFAVVGAAACGGTKPADNDAATADEPAGGAITLWTDSTELFMEHPALIVGAPDKFAVHLTDLTDFAPLRSGRITLTFMPRGGGAPLVVVQDTPRAPGIYGPSPTFTAAGVYDLVIRVESPQARDSIVVPGLTVYANAAAAPRDSGGAESGISFLKEQAWKTPGFRSAFATAGELAGSFEAPGVIEAAAGRFAQVSAPIAGLVDASGVANAPAPGMRVSRGQTLALLAPSLGDAGSAAYAEARARLREAEDEHARAVRLYAVEAVPQRRVHEAEIRLAAAREALAGYGGGELSASGRVAVRSPVAGVIADRRVTPGSRVEAGTLLFTVVDPSVVWLRVNVPAAQAANVSRTAGVEFRVEGSERVYVARRVVSLGSVIDSLSRSVPLLLEVANTDGTLKVGAAARVSVRTGQREAGVTMPASAVLDEDGRPIAYVQLEGETFERRTLELGPRAGGLVLVRRGIQAGERVVTGAAYQVRLASLSTAVPAHGHEH